MVRPDSVLDLAASIRQVEQRIAAAARRAGRDPAEVTLVAVTKTVPAATVAAAAQLGLTHFGENRVQELAAKVPAVRALLGSERTPEWHLIGHLQTNKARLALAHCDTVESVDSLRLAERLSAEAGRSGRTVRILLEVNVAGEATKYGFDPKELLAASAAIARLPNLAVRGLMTVAPLVADPEEARSVFRALRQWRDRLREAVPSVDWGQLSMGMSGDYEVAIEEGATIVRVGRALFGERSASAGG